MDNFKTYDHHYLLSKDSDTYIEFFPGRPLKVEIFWINLFMMYYNSRQSRMDEVDVEKLSTPNFTCYKKNTMLIGNFEYIIILLHSHKIMFDKGQ